MEVCRRGQCDKENDFKKGNKRQQEPPLQKWTHSDKPYHSLSASLHLRPTFPASRRPPPSHSAHFVTLYSDELHLQDAHVPPSPRFLDRHEIDAGLRAKMLDWMVEVTSSYRFSSKTFFDGVHLMDRYFEAERERVVAGRLHLVGVASMLVASKMNEVVPLKLRTVFEKIGHRKLPLQELVEMEQLIMARLDYALNSWTFYDRAMLKLTEFAVYDLTRRQHADSQPSDAGLARLERLCEFVCRHVAFDYELQCEQSAVVIGEACARVVLEIARAGPQPVGLFGCPAIALEVGKQRVLRAMRRFKGVFAGLTNIFRFTNEEILTEVAEASLY